MKTKICPECGKTFDAKRSDAICCSDKCRSSFNYKRKERKKQGFQTSSENSSISNFQNPVELSGKLELNHLTDKISVFEKQILRISDEIKTSENKNDILNQQIVTLKEKMIMLEMGEKLQLKKRAEMSDYSLYNNFLNASYQTAKNNGDQFAKTRLKTEEDLQSKFNHELKLEIQNYRSAIATKIEKLNWELNIIRNQLEALRIEQDQTNFRISDLHKEMRFYEARILKYESLLSG